MENKLHFEFKPAHLRLLALTLAATVLVACGGGSDTQPTPTPPVSTPNPTPDPVPPTPDPPTPPVPDPPTPPVPDPPTPPTPDPTPNPAALLCDPAATPGVAATFAASGATGVQLSNGGTTASFDGTAAVGVRSTVAVPQGAKCVYYFEARRNHISNVYMGVSGTAAVTPPNDSVPAERPFDRVMANFRAIETRNARDDHTDSASVGDEDVLGFAVDFRSKYPVVYVIGSANATNLNPSSCVGLSGDVPCVFTRVQLARPSSSMWIYAYHNGINDGVVRTIDINTGADLANKPFVYSPAGIRNALRLKWYGGDRGFNAQWPGTTGPAAVPAVTGTGNAWAVVRQGDTTPFRASLSVSAGSPAATTAIQWVDETGASRGSGGTLSLTTGSVAAMAVGEHTLIAGYTDPTTNRYAELKYRFTVVASDAIDSDGDGLTYLQEKSTGGVGIATDPADPDTDRDGLSDSVEVAYGFIPTVADSDGDLTRDGRELAVTSGVAPAVAAALSERITLVKETGVGTATNTGILLSEDGFSAAFTEDLNNDCVRGIAPYTDPVYLSAATCKKRALRPGAGIRQGEFRYFETRRLAVQLDNLGHGLITAAGQIDPYCCFTTPVHQLTPPSMGVNSSAPSIGVRLSGGPIPSIVGGSYDPASTTYYGFAVDYTGNDPVVYVVTRDNTPGLSITQGILLDGFNGTEVMPMLYGDPLSNTEVRAAVNFGLQPFNYDTTVIRNAIAGPGGNVNTANFRPGLGLHRRP